MKKTVLTHYGAFEPGTGEKLNGLLREFSGGAVRVEEFIPREMVTEADMIRRVSAGEIAFTRFGSMFPMTWVPDYDAGGIPFVFSSIEDVETYWKSGCGRLAKDLIRKRGNTVLLQMHRRSPRHLTANVPVVHPEGLKGFRLRIPEIPSWADIWDSMGADTVQMPQQYVLEGLKKGSLDGQENSLKVIRDFRLYEAQKYIMLTGHIHGHIYWVMNGDFYDRMEPEARRALGRALEMLTGRMNQELKSRTEMLERELKKLGCELIQADSAEFRRAASEGIRRQVSGMAPEAAGYVSRYMD